jgi:salicylate hydroxylase
MVETNGDTKPFRVAIVGGAIGGLTCALFLDHFCRQVPAQDGRQLPPIAIDVYEQASEYKEIGAGVGLGINAARLIHHIEGVGPAMNKIQGRTGSSWFTFCRWDNGEFITHVDSPVSDEDVVRPSSMARSEFLDVLLGFIRERNVATLHTNKKFTSVKVWAGFFFFFFFFFFSLIVKKYFF